MILCTIWSSHLNRLVCLFVFTTSTDISVKGTLRKRLTLKVHCIFLNLSHLDLETWKMLVKYPFPQDYKQVQNSRYWISIVLRCQTHRHTWICSFIERRMNETHKHISSYRGKLDETCINSLWSFDSIKILKYPQ